MRTVVDEEEDRSSRGSYWSKFPRLLFSLSLSASASLPHRRAHQTSARGARLKELELHFVAALALTSSFFPNPIPGQVIGERRRCNRR